MKAFYMVVPRTKDKEELQISLQINNDGVSLFYWSSFSIWPVHSIINELASTTPKVGFAFVVFIASGHMAQVWFFSSPKQKAQLSGLSSLLLS